MVSLVEDVENVPNNKITNNVAIMYQYSFALNRYDTGCTCGRTVVLLIILLVLSYHCNV